MFCILVLSNIGYFDPRSINFPVVKILLFSSQNAPIIFLTLKLNVLIFDVRSVDTHKSTFYAIFSILRNLFGF